MNYCFLLPFARLSHLHVSTIPKIINKKHCQSIFLLINTVLIGLPSSHDIHTILFYYRYDIILDCTRHEPDDRPKFGDLKDKLVWTHN